MGTHSCGLPQLGALRDEAALVVIASVVYAASTLSLFGRGWLSSMIR